MDSPRRLTASGDWVQWIDDASSTVDELCAVEPIVEKDTMILTKKDSDFRMLFDGFWS